MRAFSDTHALVWFLSGQERRLGRAAARAFRQAQSGRGEVLVSAISIFEVSLLRERRRVRTELGWDDWVEAAGRLPGLTIVPLTLEHVAQAGRMPRLADPFDRLIAATAVVLGVPLLTADGEIASTRVVKVVWD